MYIYIYIYIYNIYIYNIYIYRERDIPPLLSCGIECSCDKIYKVS